MISIDLLLCSALSLLLLCLTTIFIFLPTLYYSKLINNINHAVFITPHRSNYMLPVVVRHDREQTEGAVDLCGVCLSEIEHGEDIRRLRCHHLFHKDCLHRWMSTGHTTCPLCRGPLASPAVVVEGGAELVLLQFFPDRNLNRHDDNWWLR
ncbi:hypothetical protein Ancab_020991 [Ancistrocladus abbreviatus]